MKIYKEDKQTIIDGENHLTIMPERSNWGDVSKDINHLTIKNFHHIGYNKAIRRKLKVIWYVIKYLFKKI